ncbi:glutathione synthetase-like [Clavelina lepadiformis]|uniref:glutathione synthetase-like n=1 Tax=Clavelina lepadiformis TaxID=159417 RepID=UPI0040430CCD
MLSLYSKLRAEDVGALVDIARHRSLSKGIVFWESDDQLKKTCKPASFTLLPSLVTKEGFQFLTSLQPHINKLLHKVSHDHQFLAKVLESLVNVDDFIKRLYDLYKASKCSGRKGLELGVFRSDYLFHLEVDENGKESHIPKQIEMNTLACAFMEFGSKLTSVHSSILKDAGMETLTSQLPSNKVMSEIGFGFQAAWEAYDNPDAIFLFMINECDPNNFDVRAMEDAISKVNKDIVIRKKKFSQLFGCVMLTPDKKLMVNNEEVAVVYFQTGYRPEDYINERSWDIRRTIEMSCAVVSPVVGYQLAGFKRVQEALAQPNVLEKFIDDPEVARQVRSTFVGFYPLEMNSDGDKFVQMAMKNPDSYVVKEEREGEGDNHFGDDIIKLFNEVGSDKRRCAYTLMDKICPKPIDNVFVTANGFEEVKAVSEFGTFGVILTRGDKIIENFSSGHLLRTTPGGSNDGRCLTGAAVLDSPILV